MSIVVLIVIILASVIVWPAAVPYVLGVGVIVCALLEWWGARADRRMEQRLRDHINKKRDEQ